ncbi:TPA: hypothetical protein ACMUTW_002990, partial [Enterococcus faecium]
SHNTAAFTTPYNFCQKKCCHSKLLIELVSSLSSFGKMKRFNVILEIFAWLIPSFIWFFYIFIVESELIAKVSLGLLIPI